MLMTLILIKDKNTFWHTSIHSNHHHLKVLKGIVNYFKYGFLGIPIGNKEKISSKELKDKITKLVFPYEIYEWEKGFDLRSCGRDHISGFIVMELSEMNGNELYVNIATSEPEDELYYDQLKVILKHLRKKR